MQTDPTREGVAARIFESSDLRLYVVETRDGIDVVVRRPGADFGDLSASLGPEEIAHLNHALSRWIARFTSNA